MLWSVVIPGRMLAACRRGRAPLASLRALLCPRPVPLARCLSSDATAPIPCTPKLVHVELNGQVMQVPEYSTVLEAARASGIFIPTLCAHPSIPARGTCRVCMVDIESERNPQAGPMRRTDGLQPACVTKVREGMKVHTHTKAVLDNIRFILQLLRAKHPNTCATCDADGQCTFQDLLYRFQVEEVTPPGVRRKFVHSHEWEGCPLVAKAVDTQAEVGEGEAYNAIVLDPDKCIKCGRCVTVCQEVQGVGAIGFTGRSDDRHISTFDDLSLDRTKCIECGQCASVCPTGAMRERHDIFAVLDLLQDKHTLKVACVAPSVRVAISEELGLPPGGLSMQQLVAALKALGFDIVFDTNFTADLTIVEEGSELLSRLLTGSGPLPMFTSCCPGWINLVEKSYPHLIPHLSTCKSPQGMMGSVVKNVYAPHVGRDPSEVSVVSIMPCTAKKDEAHRTQDSRVTFSPRLGKTVANNDFVLTTRELGRLLRLHHIHPSGLSPLPPDDPLGDGTGAAVLFGATGGVMEAALRTAYELAAKQPLPNLVFEGVRGLDGVKRATVSIPDPAGGPAREVRVGVVHGTAQTRALLEKIEAGDPDAQFDFVEVMACRGGCIGGGGQPKSDDPLILHKRMAAVYDLDERSTLRKSHENPSVAKLYETELRAPGGHRAHELLHTHYSDRSKGTH